MAGSGDGGWRVTHIGFERDGVRIGGVDVWAARWVAQGDPPASLPHPAHPGQIHRFDVYEAEGVRFAAAELSNGVWGFYVPEAALPPDRSADGSLHWERCEGEAMGGVRRDGAHAAIVLRDADGGQIVDCGAWPSSRIDPQPDGRLHLRLDRGGFDALFEIDPPARRFRDLGEPGGWRPLAQLADAVEQARRATTPAFRHIGPGGALRVDLTAEEWSNTHWVHAPRVIVPADGRVLLDLWGSDWDAGVSFPAPDRVRLGLRRYHHGGAATVELDAAQGRYRIEAGGEGPVAETVPAIEAAARRSAAHLPPRRPTIRQHPLAAWRAALLILIGAAAAVAIATFVTLRWFPEEKPPLDPAFPADAPFRRPAR